MPVTMYAVTFGSFNSLVSLVSAKPHMSMIATVMMPTDAEEPFSTNKAWSCSNKPTTPY